MSDVSKRKFLKMLSLAPAAAVGAKTSIAEAITKAGNTNIVAGGLLGPGVMPGPPGVSLNEASRWQNELRWATERLTNLNDVPDDFRLPSTIVASIQADQLRSVSPAVRLLIVQREASRREREHRIGSAERMIKLAKKKLGILGIFLD